MKKNIHPKYQKVLFVDSSTGSKFVCGASLQTEETEVFEGVEYPVYRVAVSAASHPFFCGKQGILDTEGRIDKFRSRYQKKPKQEEASKTPHKKP